MWTLWSLIFKLLCFSRTVLLKLVKFAENSSCCIWAFTVSTDPSLHTTYSLFSNLESSVAFFCSTYSMFPGDVCISAFHLCCRSLLLLIMMIICICSCIGMSQIINGDWNQCIRLCFQRHLTSLLPFSVQTPFSTFWKGGTNGTALSSCMTCLFSHVSIIHPNVLLSGWLGCT